MLEYSSSWYYCDNNIALPFILRHLISCHLNYYDFKNSIFTEEKGKRKCKITQQQFLQKQFKTINNKFLWKF